ncbi:MAG: AlpA family phage regulatory protein [Paracoccaceae bacterium]|nr:AlpA family phage regulatory protein [Paracoccaceae bacterium]MDG1369258.1 AlpA family phage regulatory protein [Paracoccaceae bacterium]
MRPQRIIRLKEALQRTGYTRASWYRAQQRDPEFPQHIKLGPSQVGVLEADVDRLIQRLINQNKKAAPTDNAGSEQSQSGTGLFQCKRPRRLAQMR